MASAAAGSRAAIPMAAPMRQEVAAEPKTAGREFWVSWSAAASMRRVISARTAAASSAASLPCAISLSRFVSCRRNTATTDSPSIRALRGCPQQRLEQRNQRRHDQQSRDDPEPDHPAFAEQ